MDKGKHIDPDDDEDEGENGKFKSKNLNAERRRRKKLNDRQLELRSLVPIITNMNKASIITDAITYIEELRNTVEELTHQLHQMEAISIEDDQELIKFDEIDSEQEMKKLGITPEVQVNHICGTKLWIKIVFPKHNGGLTKLIKAINAIGFDLTDTSVTTSRGAVLFTSSAEGIEGGAMDADQIKSFLLEIIKSF
ncbi:transcription factor dysfunctional tapetum 1 [Phtheirospermum japonicum]|uniref:Transcription factor dysfunctional tapetum 1 n=1 Tax=Phtheirospermum japonicum TaxID=374723 RepID=A0A830CG18_9LAMI|nr:transcription factor dysfunctional tapetum 1 [Phtheirospermum japonicum]